MATKPQQTVQETSADFSLDTAAVLADEEHGSRSRGGARGIWPGAGCDGTTSRSRSLGDLRPDRRGVCARAGLRASRRAHRPERRTTSPTTSTSAGRKNRSSRQGGTFFDQEDEPAPRQGGHDPRPDVVAGRRQVRPRRRRQRPGRRRPAALRRHQLAQGRHRLGADLHPVLHHPRAARRVLRRLRRTG